MESRVEGNPREREMPGDDEEYAKAEGRRHALILTAGTAIAMVILITLINDSQRGVRDMGGFPGVSITPEERSSQLYIGVPQHGMTLGSDRAPLRMVEFIDLQCPYCAEYSTMALPSIVNNYVRTNKVQLELRPLAFLGRDSAVAARAAAAAAAQNRLWQFVDFYFLNQGQENGGYVTTAFLRRLAAKARANPRPILAAARSQLTPPLLARSAREARRYGVTGTPSFLFGRRGGPLRMLKVPHLNDVEFGTRIDRAYKRWRATR